MSERKVLNKYYPADYDPSKIPKGKRNKNATFNIRIMAPFNMRCNMCKEYIYKGKKFNSRKEDVMDETYLGLRIFRFYIKCPRCVSEIAFKTDLENTDYTLEAGAKRLFEAEKIAQKMAEDERKAKEEDEMNPMKLLENRTKASRAEMDEIDTLEELREMNTRKNQVNTDAMLEKYRKYEELLAQLQMEKEEAELKDIFGEKGTKVVKRLNDSDSDDDGPLKKKLAVSAGSKPTDILAEDSKPVTTKKPTASWQKSVGSLSSKQKLKGLVVRKKSSALLPVSFTVTSSSNDSEHSSNNVKKTEIKDDVTLSGGVGKSCMGAVDAKTEVIHGLESGNEDKVNEANVLANDATCSNIMSSTVLENVAEKSTNLVSSSNEAGKKSALSLIGGYYDSDTDSSS